MRLARLNPGFITLAAAVSLSKALHDGKTLLLNALTGHTITLPQALGLGCKLRFVSFYCRNLWFQHYKGAE